MSRPARIAAGIAFVAIWMAAGFALKLDANSYLLIGIPLTAIFQVAVARRPISELWLRPSTRLKANPIFFALLALLAIAPIISAITTVRRHSSVPVDLWMLACLAGTIPAAYALQNFSRTSRQALIRCLLTGGLAGIALMTLGAFARHTHLPHDALVKGLNSFLLYFPVCFLIEEVSFRGALDSFIQREGDPHPWLSAFLVSALWGLWHLPVVGGGQIIVKAIGLIVVQSVIGIPLSFAWRRSGNLAVSAAVHSLVDAVRNGLGLMG